MRLRLLLILLVAVSGLGADCGGGSSHGSASSSESVTFANTEGGSGFVPAVPEPSAVLVFGVGLLLAGTAIRRNR
jgi:PEP-CTERM motif